MGIIALNQSLGNLLRSIYTFLFYLALPFIFLRLLWRSRRAPDYRRRWAERLGFCPQHLKRCIWLHAVSVGETVAAVPLINALLAEYPTIPVMVTTMTPTGSARVKALFGERVSNAYVPYDLPDAIVRFIKRVNPVLLIVMETELWPNLFLGCEKQHVPIVLANACLSQKSAQGYRRIPSLTQQMFSALSAIAAQTKADAEHFIALGMPAEKVSVAGNLKFELKLPADLNEKKAVLREQLGASRLIWVAASTHAGEEEIMLAAHRMIQKSFPNSLLILVPRHPERFASVAMLIEKNGFSVARRSQQAESTAVTDVYLGDTMGELLLMYAVSDVAWVGGSFVDIGGHNLLEPAALKKPVMTGSYLSNVVEIRALLERASALSVVKDSEELACAVIQFFEDKSYRVLTGERGCHVVEDNRGALERHLQVVKKYAH